MRLTKRAYAFLCRQYRLILQQNHFANAVCRGLVAGAMGAALSAGAMLGSSLECAYAAVTPTLGVDSAYSITSTGVVGHESDYLTTFTTKDAGGTETVHGIKLLTGGGTGVASIDDVITDSLTNVLPVGGYTITYTPPAPAVTPPSSGTYEVTQGGVVVTDKKPDSNGNYIGNYKREDYYAGVVGTPIGTNNYLRGIVSNYGNIPTIQGDFVNNTLYYSYSSNRIAYGGAIYNGTNKETSSGPTAYIGSIEGDFVNNRASVGTKGAGHGGAIANVGSYGWTANIGNITGNFIGNSASDSGGAIVQFGSQASIGNITGDFYRNIADYGSGGAIFIADGTVGNIKGDFIANISEDGGGAILNDGSMGAITGDFIENKVTIGGGGAIYNDNIIRKDTINGETYSIKGDFIENIAASRDGGAIFNDGIIEGDIIGNFIENSAQGSGGAIYNDGKITADIHAQFINNTSVGDGGAICNDTGSSIGQITGDFISNIATSTDSEGGAIYSNGHIGDIGGYGGAKNQFLYNEAHSNGGAIYLSSSADVENFHSDFIGNKGGTDTGIAPYVEDFVSGGALYVGGDITTFNGTFSKNSITNSQTTDRTGNVELGARGGALYNQGTIHDMTADFTENMAENSSVEDSVNTTLSANGGAIYNAGDILKLTADFTENKAQNTASAIGGAKTVGHGGAIYNIKTMTNVSGDFIENSALTKGGAVYNTKFIEFLSDGSDSLDLDNAFTDNYTSADGGITKDYNAMYLNGGYNYIYTAESRFTMGETAGSYGTFTINDSILGQGYFKVSVIGVDKAHSILTLNDELKEDTLTYRTSALALQDATLKLNSFSHDDGSTTYGSVAIDEINAYGASQIALTLADNNIDVGEINLVQGATLGIDTENIGPTTPNVKTKNLNLGLNSTLNLTGDTVMAVSDTTTINSATINVGVTNTYATDESTLTLATTNASAGKINVSGSTSELTATDVTTLTNASTLTVENEATANLQAVNMNASQFLVETAATASLTTLTAGNASTVTVDGLNSALTATDLTTLNGSVFTVKDQATATLEAVNMDASQFLVEDTQNVNLTGLLTAKNGSLVSLVDTDTTDTINTTLTPSMGATLDNSTLSLTEGVTYATTTTAAKTTFTNGGLIQIQGGESESAPLTDRGRNTYAKFDLQGDLVLDGTVFEITDGADVRMSFSNDAIITAKGSDRSTVHVHGEGSTLMITVAGGPPSELPENVVLALDDHAIFKSAAPSFAFKGGAGVDNVLNVSVFDGSYALFTNAYLSNADIKVADTGTASTGGDNSAFVANNLALEHGTFTVRNSYAQTDRLFAEQSHLVTTPASPFNALGNATDSSALRIAAGGIFVLGDTGLTNPDMETKSKELFAGLKAEDLDPNNYTVGVTGSDNASWTGLGILPDGTLDPNDSAYGFSIDENHSAFIATKGQTLSIGAGSALIIDADADDMISGGANEHLNGSIPLYIGHDDVLLIDNIDSAFNGLTGKGVITIENNNLDTAYVLDTGSKIRIIVKDSVASGLTPGEKFAVIYDNNHAGDAHHAPGTYDGDIFFTLGDPSDLTDKTQNKFDTCGHVTSDGDSYLDDNRIISKGYDTIIVGGVQLSGGGPETYTVYEFQMNAMGIKPNFGVEDELFSSLVNVYLEKKNALNSEDDATRFLTKTTVYATEKHDKDAAIKLGSVTEIAVVGGVANMAHDVMTSSTNALGNYLDNGITNMGAYDERGAFSLWGMPMYSQSTVDGIKVGSIEGGYETELVAGIMGIDVRNNSGRIGVSFTAGVGETSSTRDFLQTQSDTNFYGGGLYGQYKFGDFSFRADLGYYMTENSLNQESCYDDFSNVTADVDATIMTAGFDASYLFNLGENWRLRPHAGARYSLYNQGEFTSQVNNNDFFTTKDADMSLISVPLGLSLLNTFRLGDWTFQPRLDASVIFNFGDTSVDNDVTAPSLREFGTANIEADVLDEYILSGNIGLDVNYNAFTFGLDYSLQHSERRTAHGLFGMVRYEF